MCPATGDRLTCTSKIERNTLMRLPGFPLRDSSTTSITRPSAGETIVSESAGGVLLGSRKKNITKRPRKTQNTGKPVPVKPRGDNAGEKRHRGKLVAVFYHARPCQEEKRRHSCSHRKYSISIWRRPGELARRGMLQ